VIDAEETSMSAGT